MCAALARMEKQPADLDESLYQSILKKDGTADEPIGKGLLSL